MTLTLSMIVKDSCWTPTQKPNSRGYIRVNWGGKKAMLHRVFYEDFIGEIPRGLVLDHLCRTRTCVNPKHLEPVTPRENVLRGQGLAAKNAVKAECKRGHSYLGENLYSYKRMRFCRMCRNISQQEYYRRVLCA